LLTVINMDRSFWFSFLLKAALCALCLPAQARVTYGLTQVGDPFATPYDIPHVSDLNDKGEIVGTIFPGDVTRPFLWRDGVFTDIGDLLGGAARYAEAIGINDRSEIVGVSLSPNETFRGFFWRDGQMRDLGSFADAAALFATRINARRQILGDAFDNEGDHTPFVQQGSHVRELTALPRGDGFRNVSNQNELGVVVGTSDSPAGRRAVIWKKGRVRSLGVLPGATHSFGVDINDFEQVVGFAVAEGVRPFFWQSGHMAELPMLHVGSDWITEARSINNRGQIVGTEFFAPLPEFVPLLWENGAVFELNDLVASDDPLKPYVTLLNAQIINNRGQIVATGVDSRAPDLGVVYLLTPIGR
jgi:probable HAF family extracellular repeat protein